VCSRCWPWCSPVTGTADPPLWICTRIRPDARSSVTSARPAARADTRRTGGDATPWRRTCGAGLRHGWQGSGPDRGRLRRMRSGGAEPISTPPSGLGQGSVGGALVAAGATMLLVRLGSGHTPKDGGSPADTLLSIECRHAARRAFGVLAPVAASLVTILIPKPVRHELVHPHDGTRVSAPVAEWSFALRASRLLKTSRRIGVRPDSVQVLGEREERLKRGLFCSKWRCPPSQV
jgi:hypothetical protein